MLVHKSETSTTAAGLAVQTVYWWVCAVDSKFLEGVKKVFGFGDEQKELVDPYFIFAFAGKEVTRLY